MSALPPAAPAPAGRPARARSGARPNDRLGRLHTHRPSDGGRSDSHRGLFGRPLEHHGRGRVSCAVPRLLGDRPAGWLLHHGPGLRVRRLQQPGLLSVPHAVCREAGLLQRGAERPSADTGRADVIFARCGGGRRGRGLLGPRAFRDALKRLTELRISCPRLLSH